MLDRWSIMTFERNITFPCSKEEVLHQDELAINSHLAHEYEDSILIHIASILHSDQEGMIFSTAE